MSVCVMISAVVEMAEVCVTLSHNVGRAGICVIDLCDEGGGQVCVNVTVRGMYVCTFLSTPTGECWLPLSQVTTLSTCVTWSRDRM